MAKLDNFMKLYIQGFSLMLFDMPFLTIISYWSLTNDLILD